MFRIHCLIVYQDYARQYMFLNVSYLKVISVNSYLEVPDCSELARQRMKHAKYFNVRTCILDLINFLQCFL